MIVYMFVCVCLYDSLSQLNPWILYFHLDYAAFAAFTHYNYSIAGKQNAYLNNPYPETTPETTPGHHLNNLVIRQHTTYDTSRPHSSSSRWADNTENTRTVEWSFPC